LRSNNIAEQVNESFMLMDWKTLHVHWRYKVDKETAIKLFEDKRVRAFWDEDQEKWFFSIIDVVGILSDSENSRKYWSVLKTRLKAEGSQLATNCSQLKMKAGSPVPGNSSEVMEDVYARS
jgi:hypothetical protein